MVDYLSGIAYLPKSNPCMEESRTTLNFKGRCVAGYSKHRERRPARMTWEGAGAGAVRASNFRKKRPGLPLSIPLAI